MGMTPPLREKVMAMKIHGQNFKIFAKFYPRPDVPTLGNLWSSSLNIVYSIDVSNLLNDTLLSDIHLVRILVRGQICGLWNDL